MTFPSIRSRAGIAAVVAITIAASGAGAATLHRFAVTQGTGTGSLGATTFVQTTATASALQGEVATSPNTGIKIPFGVLGEYDAPGTAFGIGIAGLSTTGYAVAGESLGVNPALLALSMGTGNGLEAYTHSTSATASALFAENVGNGPAIAATGVNADGIDSSSSTNFSSAVMGSDDATDIGYGVFGYSKSTGGSGVMGFSSISTGVLGYSQAAIAGAPAVQAYSDTMGTELFDAVITGNDNMTYESMSLTYPSANHSGHVQNAGDASNDLAINGDVIITGAVYSACKNYNDSNPAADCTEGAASTARTNNGNLVRGYGSTHASATMEDEGEAQLTGGYAHVALDPTFASAISTRAPYLVFTTPQGDGPGLFVTRRTSAGFDVRQSLGGRSNMTFDYRIVAHPYGGSSARMAVISQKALGHMTPLSAKLEKRMHAIHKMSLQHRAIQHGSPRSLVSMPSRR